MRLGLDVDGTANSFVELVPEVVPTAGASGRKSAWTVRERLFTRELNARRQHDKAWWTVMNPGVRNRLGYPVAYSVESHGAHTRLFMSADDSPRLRAGFTEFDLWVTPYSPTELYSAGDYPQPAPAQSVA